jgi:hypothetical protein
MRGATTTARACTALRLFRNGAVGAVALIEYGSLDAVRRLVPWLLVVILGLGTLLAAVAGAVSTPRAVRYVYGPTHSYALLSGMSLAQAQTVAQGEGVHLLVMRVPAVAPPGTVIAQDLNFQEQQIVVVSDGRLHNSFAVLSPAKVPPVHRECAGGLVLYEDGNVGPLTCDGGVNVGAWENLSHGDSPLMSLGKNPSQDQVIAAICAGGRYTVNVLDSVYDLASTYYGWHFGEQLFLDYAYGLNGKGCPTSQ